MPPKPLFKRTEKYGCAAVLLLILFLVTTNHLIKLEKAGYSSPNPTPVVPRSK
jgi:hypothetical protein